MSLRTIIGGNVSLLGYMLEENLKKVVPAKEVVVTVTVAPTHEEAKTSLYYDFGTSDKVYFVVIKCTDAPLGRYDVIAEWGAEEASCRA